MSRWNDLVAASSHGSIYSTPEYLDALCSESDATFRILVAERADEIIGGIALFERTKSWERYVSSRLLVYYNGFVLKAHASKYPSERTAREIETSRSWLGIAQRRIRSNRSISRAKNLTGGAIRRAVGLNQKAA